MTPEGSPQLPMTALAFSLSAFLAITFLLCVAADFFVPALDAHALLQFFPRFSWTDAGIHHGLIESFSYGFYIAIVFGALFNFFARRSGSREVRGEKPMMSNA